ncbi:MAG: hypothetical protein A2Y25_09245 [Candidatus Melainabacteria bacterium GWF2_37_15]|nr:MAG: hypothetical protein A2Y25_09245 [Candidatus Melainabacteria bacterium GWF2_37_15]
MAGYGDDVDDGKIDEDCCDVFDVLVEPPPVNILIIEDIILEKLPDCIKFIIVWGLKPDVVVGEANLIFVAHISLFSYLIWFLLTVSIFLIYNIYTYIYKNSLLQKIALFFKKY